jgi:ABC-type phosphate/phosphonate transport system substrate-binding protein
MTEFIAALPMYDWPETRAETDAEWARLYASFTREGIAAPKSLVRSNADLPSVPGGIRNAAGERIAPDPATLPPGEFDLQALWRHPNLLLAQTCWGPMGNGLAGDVRVVGQPSYSGIEGGEGEFYSSAILMRGKGTLAPADGKPVIPLDLMRGKRLAYNGQDSMSGIIALRRDLEAAGESLGIFSEQIETGSHRASVIAVAEGRADICAIDCRTWHIAQRHEPAAREVAAVGWTARRLGLPMITSIHTPRDMVEKLLRTLAPMASS